MRSLAASLVACLLLAGAGGCERVADETNETAAGGGGVGGQTDVGGAGGAEPACDMFDSRAIAPEVLIGPDGLRDRIVAEINSATSSVALMMYQLECTPCVDALIAAHQRGVTVRVVLDDAQSVNASAESTLLGAGVAVQPGPAAFEHNHSKLLIIDEARALVMSANMNGYSFASERNYGVIDHDPQDVRQLGAIFERDWAGEGDIDTSCSRLIVSPLNARQRILQLIGSAESTLDLAIMYASDAEIRHALEVKIGDGVQVRVLLAMPEWIDSNAATATQLSAAGAQTRYLYTYELHAKLIIADGVAFVGSENLSFTSLDKNREIGMLVTETEPAAQIVAQFEADWAQGTPAP